MVERPGKAVCTTLVKGAIPVTMEAAGPHPAPVGSLVDLGPESRRRIRRSGSALSGGPPIQITAMVSPHVVPSTQTAAVVGALTEFAGSHGTGTVPPVPAGFSANWGWVSAEKAVGLGLEPRRPLGPHAQQARSSSSRTPSKRKGEDSNPRAFTRAGFRDQLQPTPPSLPCWGIRNFARQMRRTACRRSP